MAILCRLGRHVVVTRGVRNEELEFGRCDRCRCDMMRKGDSWTPVPKGYRIVWRPRTGDAVADCSAGQGAVGREVTIRGVVVGERAYGSQRFALVRLNAQDERSYRGGFDRLGSSGAVSAQMEQQAKAGLFSPRPAAPPCSSGISLSEDRELFDWERKHPTRAPARTPAPELLNGPE